MHRIALISFRTSVILMDIFDKDIIKCLALVVIPLDKFDCDSCNLIAFTGLVC